MKLQKNALEWSVFALSSLLVLGVLVLLVFDATRWRDTSSLLFAQSGAVQRRVVLKSVQFVVPISVRNEGEKTATNVRIEVTTSSRENSSEKAEVTLQWVPRHSQRETFVVLESEPSGKIAARVVAFEEE